MTSTFQNIIVEQVGVTIEDFIQPATRYLQVTMDRTAYEDEKALGIIIDTMRKYVEDNNLKAVGPMLTDEQTLWQDNLVIKKVAVEEKK